MNSNRKRVVIIGGGFGGLHAARSLRRADLDVILIDRRNFHLFQPLLYQVATGGLSPANIASPIRSILRRQKNIQVVLGNVVAVDPNSNSVRVDLFEPEDKVPLFETIQYDWLVVAAGTTHSYFGHNEWAKFAPGLKTIEDATLIRGKILSAFEAAEQEDDPARREFLMTFVIVGGGPTGVELAGAIAELANHTLRHDFRNINPSDAKIILIDGQDRMLATFSEELSKKATIALERLGVNLLFNSTVTSIADDQVTITSGDDSSQIKTETVLWAAGVAAVPLGKAIAESTGIQADRAGRIPVQQDLSIAGHENIFVIGDLASCCDDDGKPLPGVAPVAIQQGKYVGGVISHQIRGKKEPDAFVYRDKGSLATIGRSAAVADLGKFKFSGFFAWMLWLLIHIMSIAQFQNRVLVFFQWAWNYITFNRSARLIIESKSLKSDSTEHGELDQPAEPAERTD